MPHSGVVCIFSNGYRTLDERIENTTVLNTQFQLLFDCGHVSDAVHVGILAYEMGYLRNTADAAADMCLFYVSLCYYEI